jgi:hypothetical protein
MVLLCLPEYLWELVGKRWLCRVVTQQGAAADPRRGELIYSTSGAGVSCMVVNQFHRENEVSVPRLFQVVQKGRD